MKKLLFSALCLILTTAAFGQGLLPTIGTIQSTASSCSTFTASTACVIEQLPSSVVGSVAFVVTGTWSATLQFEASADNQTTWVSLNCGPQPSGALVTSTTANGTWVCAAAGMTYARVRASAFTSGVPFVVIQPSSSPVDDGPITALGPTGSAAADPCQSNAIPKLSAFANITTATTTALVAVSGATTVYVCGFAFTMTGATTTADSLLFEQGTGATCAGAPTAITATYSTGILAANAPFGLSQAGPGTIFKTAASNGLCVVSTVAATAPAIGVSITYVQQ